MQCSNGQICNWKYPKSHQYFRLHIFLSTRDLYNCPTNSSPKGRSCSPRRCNTRERMLVVRSGFSRAACYQKVPQDWAGATMYTNCHHPLLLLILQVGTKDLLEFRGEDKVFLILISSCNLQCKICIIVNIPNHNFSVNISKEVFAHVSPRNVQNTQAQCNLLMVLKWQGVPNFVTLGLLDHK